MRILVLVFMIIGVTFVSVAGGIYAGIIHPGIRDQRIADAGYTPIRAEALSMSSNVQVNGINYYRIRFRWYGGLPGDLSPTGGLGWHERWTNHGYRRHEAQAILDAGYIYIVVSRDGRAVAADFRQPTALRLLWILPLVFFVVGAGMLLTAIILLFVLRNYGKVLRNGIDGTGMYLDSGSGMMVNGNPRYWIRFTFRDDANVEHEVKTPSKMSWRERDGLQSMGQFPIKFMGKRAAITRDVLRDAARQTNNFNNSQGQNDSGRQDGNFGTSTNDPFSSNVGDPLGGNRRR